MVLCPGLLCCARLRPRRYGDKCWFRQVQAVAPAHLVALWCLLHHQLRAGHPYGDALGLQGIQHLLVVELVPAVVAAACSACRDQTADDGKIQGACELG